MVREQAVLLELVQIGLTETCCFTNTLLDVDWNKILSLASTQGVCGVCWRGLEVLHAHEINCCSSETKLQFYVRNQQLEQLFQKKKQACTDFSALVAPLELMVLKGLDYARFWKNPSWREFGDLDVYVKDKDSYLLDKNGRELGIEVEDEDYKHSQIRYNKVNVENHHFFTGFAGSAEGKDLERELKQLFAKSQCSALGNTGLLSPNVDFTAVFMLAHAQNHFFYEGMSLRMIVDWYFFLSKEEGNVDWKAVHGVLERTRLIPFADLMTKFCVKYFGLKTKFDYSLCNDDLLNRFANDLFGKKYSDQDRRWRMMIVRLLHRYKRMWQFKELLRMPIHKAVWRTIAYSSFFNRMPKLN